jgi:ATP-dependent DNA ligase
MTVFRHDKRRGNHPITPSHHKRQQRRHYADGDAPTVPTRPTPERLPSSAPELLSLVNQRIERSPYAPVGKTKDARRKKAEEWLEKHPGPWAVDLKYNGERCHIWKRGEQIIVTNKGKSVYVGASRKNHDFPDFMLEAIKKALGDRDGEFEAEYRTKDDVREHFASGRSGHSKYTKDLVITLFDVLELDGEDVRDRPLSERRKLLKDSVEPNDHLDLVESKVVETPKEVFAAYDGYRKNHEGAVVKQADGEYVSGKSTWLKLKDQNDLDVAFVGIKKTKKWKDDKEAWTYVMAVKDKDGNWIKIGNVSTGLTIEERQKLSDSIKSRLDKIKTSEDEKYIYTEPFAVAEVTYDSITEDKKLSGPARISRIRDDVTVDAASADKFESAYEQEGWS